MNPTLKVLIFLMKNHLFAMRKLIINDAYAIAGKCGELCLSTEYVNANILIRWQCADGHEWITSLNNIKNGKTWCLYYANKASHTIKDAKQIAFSKNGECLSETYYNSFSPLSWHYSEGYEWNASFNNVKNNKT